jgi:hypothetical protein
MKPSVSDAVNFRLGRDVLAVAKNSCLSRAAVD